MSNRLHAVDSCVGPHLVLRPHRLRSVMMADRERHALDRRIVILTAGGPLAKVTINAVAKQFDQVSVIQEDAETIVEMARRWFRLHGVGPALGRLAFGPLQRIAAWRSRHRRSEILEGYDSDKVWHATGTTFIARGRAARSRYGVGDQTANREVAARRHAEDFAS